jgi:hypothetical protein
MKNMPYLLLLYHLPASFAWLYERFLATDLPFGRNVTDSHEFFPTNPRKSAQSVAKFFDFGNKKTRIERVSFREVLVPKEGLEPS